MGNTQTIKEEAAHKAIKNKESKDRILALLKKADLNKRDNKGNSYTHNALRYGYDTDIIKQTLKDYKEDENGERDNSYDILLHIALKNKSSEEIILSLINDDSKCASTKMETAIGKRDCGCRGGERCNCKLENEEFVYIHFNYSYEASSYFLAKEMGYSEKILNLLWTSQKERIECHLNQTKYFFS